MKQIQTAPLCGPIWIYMIFFKQKYIYIYVYIYILNGPQICAKKPYETHGFWGLANAFSPMVQAVEGDTYWGSVIRSELIAKAQWKAFHEGKIGKTSRKILENMKKYGKIWENWI